ncbi:hypothetical protein SAMN05444143_1274 [Flavobacterium succinicans]|uniref:Uncharacterized protein n=1 Tax=Flavobacterium succinicans TaxID=29536 RepID=A0A1I5A680_9FLAO|nr:hypothetical protein [Flavobacterium succinicans]SFN57973.1 hypothetical protein SAMN05444143_1274 [Flavobacterium succinicans]
MDKETLHKEIDLIQGVINRMAHNSFLLKGWTITIIVAVLALTKDTLVTNDITYFSIILLVPLVAFWYLDAFFLHKERCYIKLYNWVIENRLKSEDYQYNLNYRRFENKVDSVWKIMYSSTLSTFYGITTIILLGITVYNIFK